MTSLILIAALCAWIAPAPAHAAETPAASASLDLTRLMALRREVKWGTAHFTERRVLGMLTTPLDSAGTLIYVAPDQLEKKTLTPQPERIFVQGNHLTFDDGSGQAKTVPLDDTPEVGALIESIRATLAGDAVTLERYYTVSVTGTMEAWRLVLTPKLPRMRAMVSAIHIAGSEGSVQSIDTEEAGGDKTIMTITEDRK